MARFGAQAGFFSSNGYHHYIGANIWRSRGQKPASRDHAGLERVVFSVGDREQFDALRARLVARAYEHSGGDREIVVLDPDSIELRFDLRT
jgi:catechol 2,3-dioxygenase